MIILCTKWAHLITKNKFSIGSISTFPHYQSEDFIVSLNSSNSNLKNLYSLIFIKFLSKSNHGELVAINPTLSKTRNYNNKGIYFNIKKYINKKASIDLIIRFEHKSHLGIIELYYEENTIGIDGMYKFHKHIPLYKSRVLIILKNDLKLRIWSEKTKRVSLFANHVAIIQCLYKGEFPQIDIHITYSHSINILRMSKSVGEALVRFVPSINDDKLLIACSTEKEKTTKLIRVYGKDFI